MEGLESRGHQETAAEVAPYAWEQRLRPGRFLAGLVLVFLGFVLMNLSSALVVAGAVIASVGGLCLLMGVGLLRLPRGLRLNGRV